MYKKHILRSETKFKWETLKSLTGVAALTYTSHLFSIDKNYTPAPTVHNYISPQLHFSRKRITRLINPCFLE